MIGKQAVRETERKKKKCGGAKIYKRIYTTFSKISLDPRLLPFTEPLRSDHPLHKKQTNTRESKHSCYVVIVPS